MAMTKWAPDNGEIVCITACGTTLFLATKRAVYRYEYTKDGWVFVPVYFSTDA